MDPEDPESDPDHSKNLIISSFYLFRHMNNIPEKNSLTLILLKIFDIYCFHYFATNKKIAFYCEKYTYHFLTIAICWCHPTHWPTLRNVLYYLKKPVSECGSRKPPNGHVTTPIGAIHCFCWPYLSVDVYWNLSFFSGSFLELLWILTVLR